MARAFWGVGGDLTREKTIASNVQKRVGDDGRETKGLKGKEM